ncbi:hypothetical protein [Cytobacillus oceanisediminis]|uniref:Uncharacterized protein n=1 Tax=Cytobacillus oceanisediminis 2691 TaxID=1196031 RepID=A0A160MEA0_9BACI|nr:hypothetical protein [Cytobacillus oceanisediminis]AND41447.1 hypothetical protein A361_20530 [Cytobacillus oceanisediminis 2691]
MSINKNYFIINQFFNNKKQIKEAFWALTYEVSKYLTNSNNNDITLKDLQKAISFVQERAVVDLPEEKAVIDNFFTEYEDIWSNSGMQTANTFFQSIIGIGQTFSVKYWEDEWSRDQGVSEFSGEYNDFEKAVASCRSLGRTYEFAEVETEEGILVFYAGWSESGYIEGIS